MIRLDYPAFDFRIRSGEGSGDLIFDGLRRRWVRLSPEEWVRQNMILYLTGVMQYPASLLAIEKEIMLGELKKRFDILVYDSEHRPWMLVECKAEDVPLTDAVLQQVLRYNLAVPVPYLVISNGRHCFGFEKKEGRLWEISSLPDWNSRPLTHL